MELNWQKQGKFSSEKRILRARNTGIGLPSVRFFPIVRCLTDDEDSLIFEWAILPRLMEQDGSEEQTCHTGIVAQQMPPLHSLNNWSRNRLLEQDQAAAAKVDHAALLVPNCSVKAGRSWIDGEGIEADERYLVVSRQLLDLIH